MKSKKVVVWFRQDLRLHDNEALSQAIAAGNEVIPVFVFDDRIFRGKTKFGFPKTGKHRTQFTIQAIHDLRNRLREFGTDLIVRTGKTEEEIFKICHQAKSSWVFCNRERTQEEVAIQDALEKKLWSIGQEIVYSRGKMLYYTQDLPFPVTHTPDNFNTFRKEVEKITAIREPLPYPDYIPRFIETMDPGVIPLITDFGFDKSNRDERSVVEFRGGETNGIGRLNYYLWESDLIKDYKKSRNGLIGESHSSMLSPWLSLGCISPKMIFHELKKYEEERGADESTYWLFFELLWRDFFRLMGKKHGNVIFQKGGLSGKQIEGLSENRRILDQWIQGRTGVPFIDAHMRELNTTGFMSNRGRQNVASFLIKELELNWQMGAEYFESLLLDYDPCSNYCNWNYIAGLGNDPRADRHINILSQAKRYDPKGDYVKLWLPELEELPAEKIHRPESLSEKEQLEYHMQLGVQYPKTTFNTTHWEKSY